MDPDNLCDLFSQMNKFQVYCLRGINHKFNACANKTSKKILPDTMRIIKDSFDLDEDREIIDTLVLSDRQKNKKIIRYDLLKYLPLDRLTIAYHQLTNVTFQIGFNYLNYLCLASNNLTHIYENTFKALHLLSVLDLKNNKIKFIDRNAFKHFVYLETLNLSYNKLIEIPKAINDVAFSLTFLDLTHNQIQFIDESLLIKCQQLKNLKFDGNYTEVSLDTLDELNLKYYNDIYIQLYKKRKY